MIKLKLRSAALVAAAVLGTPAMARASHVTSRHRAKDANASASPTARYLDGRVGILALKRMLVAFGAWRTSNRPPGRFYELAT